MSATLDMFGALAAGAFTFVAFVTLATGPATFVGSFDFFCFFARGWIC